MLGNWGHDVFDKPDGATDLENHGVYIGGPGTYEVAYNVFSNIQGGNGIQINGNPPVTQLRIHHNLIQGVGKHGLNFTDGSGTDVWAWNNIIVHTAYAGVRFGDDATRNLKLYNNTFFDTGTIGDTPSSGALTNDTNTAPNQFEVRNNIFVPHAGSSYAAGCCNPSFTGAGVLTHNLFFGGQGATAFSSDSMVADPLFVSTTPGAEDFHLRPQSPALDQGTGMGASAVVKDDFEVVKPGGALKPRPKGSGFDIGAFKFE
jgi:hypothetical protein